MSDIFIKSPFFIALMSSENSVRARKSIGFDRAGITEIFVSHWAMVWLVSVILNSFAVVMA